MSHVLCLSFRNALQFYKEICRLEMSNICSVSKIIIALHVLVCHYCCVAGFVWFCLISEISIEWRNASRVEDVSAPCFAIGLL